MVHNGILRRVVDCTKYKWDIWERGVSFVIIWPMKKDLHNKKRRLLRQSSVGRHWHPTNLLPIQVLSNEIYFPNQKWFIHSILSKGEQEGKRDFPFSLHHHFFRLHAPAKSTRYTQDSRCLVERRTGTPEIWQVPSHLNASLKDYISVESGKGISLNRRIWYYN